ncbi:response regulator [Streptomyces beihaiensis]|uniref:Response regulator transcription factor n=1 Tax=Streptomyces beihaiensis TaxID=2984495 RepID=A0ABT3U2Y6_9ACTN|nr:response regulator transcription factor [Streptomyces beihaiensis]MCX3063651.1 response regulator transcription factor [Streptomyces beihaiensis]
MPRTPTGAPGRVRVLIADDHTLFREGVAEILTAAGGLDVVGLAHDGEDACRKAAELSPDVVVLDVEMPGIGVRDSLPRLLRSCPGCHVVVLTMHDDVVLARELLALGAGAYLVKGSTRQELLSAIHGVVADRGPGHVLLSVSQRELDRVGREPADRLSAREREVLSLTADALSNAQIARRLSIAESTVKRHLRNIYGKLGAVSRLDAVNKAVAASLIPAPRSQPRA